MLPNFVEILKKKRMINALLFLNLISWDFQIDDEISGALIDEAILLFMIAVFRLMKNPSFSDSQPK